jgi:excisionase family DNA binding protein
VPQSKRPNRVGINEASEILGVAPKTIRRYIASGRLTAYRVGPRLIKVDVESIEALARPVGGGAA